MGEDLRHRINPKTLLVVPHLDNSALPTDELRQHKPPIIWCSRFHESMRGHPFPEFLIAEYEVMLDWGEPGGQGDNFWIEAVGNTAFWVRKDLHHRHLVPNVSNLLPGMPDPSIPTLEHAQWEPAKGIIRWMNKLDEKSMHYYENLGGNTDKDSLRYFQESMRVDNDDDNELVRALLGNRFGASERIFRPSRIMRELLPFAAL
ncbi:MAG: hypothetical protein Q9159_002140 [Coniocarpon cinnabarinum]